MSAPATGLPPVSVVVPTHHRPALLRDAVRSVLDQDYAGDVEVLVVLDACDLGVCWAHTTQVQACAGEQRHRVRCGGGGLGEGVRL